MVEKLRVVFTIPELRRKILLTLFLLAIYRIGWQIPLPMIDQAAVSEFAKNMGGSLSKFLAKVSVFSGSQLNNATIFGLGIMPYISASIILQLLGTVYKPLEEMKKEGEAGRKKINEYTRYLTVLLCVIQSAGYLWYMLMAGSGPDNMIASEFENSSGNLTFMWQMTAILIMTSGSIFLMWLGEQIDEYGIGNGISLLIMAGIVAQMPGALISLSNNATFSLAGFNSGNIGLEKIILLVLMFVGVVLGVVFITQGQRRIPTQSAKHVRGRRVYGGTRQYMPLRINQAGVMPIIFAQAILVFPGFLITTIWPQNATAARIADSLAHGGIHYLVTAGMIFFFSYFWVATQFQPQQIADDLKKAGGYVPGIRPGKPTADFLDNSMTRLTFAGAVFLTIIALLPQMLAEQAKIPYIAAQFFGGTSILIVVGVVLDTMKQIETHLLQRNYDGFLRKGKLRGRFDRSPEAIAEASTNSTIIWVAVASACFVLVGIVAFLIRK